MNAVSQYYSDFHNRMPYPIRAVLNVLYTPLALLGAATAVIKGQAEESPIWQMSHDELAEWFSFEIEKGHPNRDTLSPIQDKLEAYIAANDWLAVSALIENLDHSRANLPTGIRTMRPLLNAVWTKIVLQTLPDYNPAECEPVPATALPDSHIADFLSAAQAHPNNIGLQCLAAWMHLEMGWIRRGGDYVDFTGEDAFQGFEHHIKAAWILTKDINAQSVNSPLVAEIRYRCKGAGGATGLADLEKAHAEWVALDPANMEAFSLHGMFLLPRWYGSYDAVADAAQSAFATHHGETELASYAATYLGAIELDHAAMIGMNVGQFKDGLLDMTARAKNPSVALNAVCARLSDICTRTYSTTGKGEEKQIIAYKKVLKVILKKFIRQGMGTVTPAIWEPHWSELEVPYLLAEAFEDEIMAGQSVHLDHTGATITQPQA
jgi:hypothetical protein